MSTVLLTGASGFLGAHTLVRLLDAGHRVRAFVRTPSKLDAALRPFGIGDVEADDRIEVIQGDMTHAADVQRAVREVDRVIHAAAIYSFKRSDRDAMLEGNVQGTRLVLDAAASAGCERIVHVSSTVALNRRGGHVLRHDSPLGEGFGPYSDSKVASEKVAREAQDAGRPISIVNPAGVIGPHDPYLGESNAVIQDCVRGKLTAWPRGSMTYVDVRETADVLVAAVAHEENGRWLVPGTDVTSPHGAVREASGRKLPYVTVPTALAVAATLPGYLTGWKALPGEVEGARITGCANPTDASATIEALGVRPRPLVDSVRDTLEWLRDASDSGRAS